MAKLKGMKFPMSVSAIAGHVGATQEQIKYLIGRRQLHLAPSLSDTRVFYGMDKENHDGDFSARAWFGGANW